MRFRFLAFVLCCIASGGGDSAAEACQTTKSLPADEVVTPMECAIDSLIPPLLARLDLVSQETLDTRLISADVDARGGHPGVRLSFEHWLAFDQVEEMHRRGLGGDVALGVRRERFAQSLLAAISATFDGGALAFFDAGGEMGVLVVLKAIDGDRKADAAIDLADVTIHGCGVS